jgi:hypothetical protein
MRWMASIQIETSELVIQLEDGLRMTQDKLEFVWIRRETDEH